MKKAIRKVIRLFLKRFLVWWNRKSEMEKREKMITKNFKKLENHRKLTKAQKKEVQDYYVSMIGQKVPLYSHEYFYSRTGVFTKDYVPTNLYHCELLPKANDKSMAKAYCDKNICDLLFPGENVAHYYLKNMHGYYYFEGKPVSKEEAIELCGNLKEVIIKPALKSKGNGVQLMSFAKGVNEKGETVEQVFKRYKSDFLIQKRVKQHKDMAALNPSSLNTIRVLSYRSGMEVLIIYSVIRIGRAGQVVDNQCAGGISTTITSDGKLGKVAFGGYSTDNILKTDSGVVLEGYQIPSYDKSMEMVKRLHLRLPYFNIIGWDIAIEEDGNPILIEINTSPGLSQSAFKSGMGEYTERIIRELWPRPNTQYRRLSQMVK